MRKIVFLILLSLIPEFIFGQSNHGYEIDITISDLQDSTVFLAYHLGDKQYISDTIKLDKTGHGVVQGKDKAYLEYFL